MLQAKESEPIFRARVGACEYQAVNDPTGGKQRIYKRAQNVTPAENGFKNCVRGSAQVNCAAYELGGKWVAGLWFVLHAVDVAPRAEIV
jgi:hypothetical protein